MCSMKTTWMKKTRQMLDSSPSTLFIHQIFGIRDWEVIQTVKPLLLRMNLKIFRKEFQRQTANEHFLMKELSKGLRFLFQIYRLKRTLISNKTIIPQQFLSDGMTETFSFKASSKLVWLLWTRSQLRSQRSIRIPRSPQSSCIIDLTTPLSKLLLKTRNIGNHQLKTRDIMKHFILRHLDKSQQTWSL